MKRVELLQTVRCAAGTECVIVRLDTSTTGCVGDMCGLPYTAQCVGEQSSNLAY